MPAPHEDNMSKIRNLLIAFTFVLSLHSAEPAATQEIVDPAATIIGFDKLNEVQLSAYRNVGGFSVQWTGLPAVSNLIRDRFELIEIRLISDKLKTQKKILFDVHSPCIYVDMEVDGGRVIFGPIVYGKSGEILTYPYGRSAEIKALTEMINGK
jgi:hypothetical protein